MYMDSVRSVLPRIIQSFPDLGSRSSGEKNTFASFTGLFLNQGEKNYIVLRYVYGEPQGLYKENHLLLYKIQGRVQVEDEMFLSNTVFKRVGQSFWGGYKIVDFSLDARRVILGTRPASTAPSRVSSRKGAKKKRRSARDNDDEEFEPAEEDSSDDDGEVREIDEGGPCVMKRMKAGPMRHRRLSQGKQTVGSSQAGSSQAGSSQAGSSQTPKRGSGLQEGQGGASGSVSAADGATAGAPEKDGAPSGTQDVQPARAGAAPVSNGSPFAHEETVGLFALFSDSVIAATCADPDSLIRVLKEESKRRARERREDEKRETQSVPTLVDLMDRRKAGLEEAETQIRASEAGQSGSHRFSKTLGNRVCISDFLEPWMCKMLGFKEDDLKLLDKPAAGATPVSGDGGAPEEDEAPQPARVPARRQKALEDLSKKFDEVSALCKTSRYITLDTVPRRGNQDKYELHFLLSVVNQAAAALFSDYLHVEADEEFCICVLCGHQALLDLPQIIRDGLPFRKETVSFTHIIESPHEEDTHPDALIRYFCLEPHVDICKKWDTEAGRRLTEDGVSLHDIAQKKLRDIVADEIDRDNKRAEAIRKKKERIEEQNQQLGYMTDGGVKRSARVVTRKNRKEEHLSVDQEYNPPSEPRTAPKAFKVVIIPFAMLAGCSQVGGLQRGFLHDPSCPCGSLNPKRNPLVEPWFEALYTRSIKCSTAVAGGIALPRTLLGLCDVAFMCHHAKKRISK